MIGSSSAKLTVVKLEHPAKNPGSKTFFLKKVTEDKRVASLKKSIPQELNKSPGIVISSRLEQPFKTLSPRSICSDAKEKSNTSKPRQSAKAESPISFTFFGSLKVFKFVLLNAFTPIRFNAKLSEISV